MSELRFLVAVFLLCASCDSGKTAEDGSAGGKCYGNGTCNEGLLCSESVCRAVRPLGAKSLAAKPQTMTSAPVIKPLGDGPSMEQAEAMVKSWLLAQNEGSFGKYEALYHSGFGGIRRSGKKIREFDRDGWLQDRKRMFRHPMVVSIEGEEFTPITGEVLVRFTQTWAQGTYKDVGKKELRLKEVDGGWLIVSENMLDSELLVGQAKVIESNESQQTSDSLIHVVIKNTATQCLHNYSDWGARLQTMMLWEEKNGRVQVHLGQWGRLPAFRKRRLKGRRSGRKVSLSHKELDEYGEFTSWIMVAELDRNQKFKKASYQRYQKEPRGTYTQECTYEFEIVRFDDWKDDGTGSPNPMVLGGKPIVTQRPTQ